MIMNISISEERDISGNLPELTDEELELVSGGGIPWGKAFDVAKKVGGFVVSNAAVPAWNWASQGSQPWTGGYYMKSPY